MTTNFNREIMPLVQLYGTKAGWGVTVDHRSELCYSTDASCKMLGTLTHLHLTGV